MPLPGGFPKTKAEFRADRDAEQFGRPLTPPTSLRSIPAPVYIRNIRGVYTMNDLPQDRLKPAATIRLFVDLTNRTGNASDANDGLTRATPLLTEAAAFPKINGNNFQIVFFGVQTDTLFRRTAGWPNVNFNYSVVNESPGRPMFARTGNTAAPTWTAVNGQAGVFSTPIATVADAANIIDTANKVDMAARIKIPVGGTARDMERWRSLVRSLPAAYHVPMRVASIAAVRALPGSWFYDAANGLLYCQAIDSRNLVGDTRMQPLSTGVFARAANAIGRVTWFSGFDMFGGSPPIYGNPSIETNTEAMLIIENMSMQASASAGGSTSGVGINGPLKVIAYRSAAWNNWQDNWSYTSLDGNYVNTPNGASAKVLEIECAAGGGGMTGATTPSDNAFTSHVTSDTTSINCVAVDSSDRVIADINNARRWWVGGYIGAPTDATGASPSNVGTGDIAAVVIDGAHFAPALPGTFNVGAEQSSTVLLRGVDPGVTVNPAHVSRVTRSN